MSLERLWGFRAELGRILGDRRGVWGPLGGPFGELWGDLGVFWRVLGSFLRALRGSWELLLHT